MLSKGLPYLETKVRVKGEICREGSKVRVKGGRDLQRRGGGSKVREVSAKRGGGAADDQM